MSDALPFAAVEVSAIVIAAAIGLAALAAVALVYRLAARTGSAAGAQCVGCLSVPLIAAVAGGVALRLLGDSDFTDALLGAGQLALVGLIPGVILGWAAGRRQDEPPPTPAPPPVTAPTATAPPPGSGA